MKASVISALLVAGSYAMPAALHKRATFTVDEVVTVWTTTTVFVDPTDAPAAFAELSSSSSVVSSSIFSSKPSSSSAATSSAAAAPAVVTTPAAAPVVTPAPVVAAVTTPAPAPAPVVPAPAAVVPAPAPVVPAPVSGLVSGTGDLTYYELSAGLTSCGGSYTDSDAVVALSYPDMNNGANPNANPLCGQSITITYNGVTATGKVVDSCQGCAQGSIDLSPTLFNQLVGGPGAGRVSGAHWVVT
jgi:hypothetical protein